MNEQTPGFKTLQAWLSLYNKRNLMTETLVQGAVRALAAGATFATITRFCATVGLRWSFRQAMGPTIIKGSQVVRNRWVPLMVLGALGGGEAYAARGLSDQEARLGRAIHNEALTDKLMGAIRPNAGEISVRDLIASLVIGADTFADSHFAEDHALFAAYMDRLYEDIASHAGHKDLVRDDVTPFLDWRVPSPFTPGLTKFLNGAGATYLTASDSEVLRGFKWGLIQGILWPITGCISMRVTAALTAIYGVTRAVKLSVITENYSDGSYYDPKRVIQLVDFVIERNADFAEFLRRHEEQINSMLEWLLSVNQLPNDAVITFDTTQMASGGEAVIAVASATRGDSRLIYHVNRGVAVA